ncbi:hypothetical protein SAMN04488528_100829 [Clostridium frigidicarnis]|uniref:Uncharacterized protein n=1 Tax=Clostridium frigidicarnis TaxID=84698 RepID=A0A1I0XDT3_9CLOT|nr:hypothetical protein SAMN04488528_100829 [Clostridium frigidicarnis]
MESSEEVVVAKALVEKVKVNTMKEMSSNNVFLKDFFIIKHPIKYKFILEYSISLFSNKV